MAILFIAACLVFYLLVVGKNLLIPLVLAVFFWYLISVVTVAIQRPSIKERHLPRPVAFVLSLLLIAGAAGLLVSLVTENVSQVVRAAPVYQRNLERLVAEGYEMLSIEEPPPLGQLFDKLDLSNLISRIAAALASLVGDAGLVTVYLFFLFMEEKFFTRKLEALVPEPERRKRITAILDRIGEETRTYVGLKTGVSLLTAALSYVIMKAVGLDYAEFWAILIFVFNFIPNIGSLIATLMPSLLALVQYETMRPFFMVAGGVTAVQLFVANVIEPRLMGSSLNLSPLVIILSLVVWGTVWGIAGMFLCVPLMVVLIIILANFPATRPLAVLLSRDGRLQR